MGLLEFLARARQQIYSSRAVAPPGKNADWGQKRALHTDNPRCSHLQSASEMLNLAVTEHIYLVTGIMSLRCCSGHGEKGNAAQVCRRTNASVW